MTTKRLSNHIRNSVLNAVIRDVFLERKEAAAKANSALAYAVWEARYPVNVRRMLTSPEMSGAAPVTSYINFQIPSTYSSFHLEFGDGERMPVFDRHARSYWTLSDLDPAAIPRIAEAAKQNATIQKDYERSVDSLRETVAGCLNSVSTVAAAIKAYPALEKYLEPFREGGTTGAGKSLAIPGETLENLIKQYRGETK